MQATTIPAQDHEVEVIYRPRGGPARRLRVTLDARDGAIAVVGGKRVWLEASCLELVVEPRRA